MSARDPDVRATASMVLIVPMIPVRGFGTGGADPSLNVDPTRNGVEPDIAFTGNSAGVQDRVPWVVWYWVAVGSQGWLVR